MDRLGSVSRIFLLWSTISSTVHTRLTSIPVATELISTKLKAESGSHMLLFLLTASALTVHMPHPGELTRQELFDRLLHGLGELRPCLVGLGVARTTVIVQRGSNDQPSRTVAHLLL